MDKFKCEKGDHWNNSSSNTAFSMSLFLKVLKKNDKIFTEEERR